MPTAATPPAGGARYRHLEAELDRVRAAFGVAGGELAHLMGGEVRAALRDLAADMRDVASDRSGDPVMDRATAARTVRNLRILGEGAGAAAGRPARSPDRPPPDGPENEDGMPRTGGARDEALEARAAADGARLAVARAFGLRGVGEPDPGPRPAEADPAPGAAGVRESDIRDAVDRADDAFGNGRAVRPEHYPAAAGAAHLRLRADMAQLGCDPETNPVVDRATGRRLSGNLRAMAEGARALLKAAGRRSRRPVPDPARMKDLLAAREAAGNARAVVDRAFGFNRSRDRAPDRPAEPRAPTPDPGGAGPATQNAVPAGAEPGREIGR